ncbi:hypothetical protein [Stenotrophomonas sp.]|uniref:hypothetical protein n=1 Tax=Stenotrophomonas sp. TaxID=69392 RepID=UPI0028A706C3|nr:hypothetical protein [Stenotrophomonas sp.]
MNYVPPAVLVVAMALALPAHAGEGATSPGNGLHEIPDEELGQMRGRYTVGGNEVAWFGVTMISTWQAANGQSLQGALQIGMDFRDGGSPKVSFAPSVTVTAANAPLPDVSGRSINGAGLDNVAGLSQSVQIAGDGNRASNVLQLNVRNDGVVPSQAGGAGNSSAQQGAASAVATFDGSSARLQLQVQGQGAVQQWLRNGAMGQSIQLLGDGQVAQNLVQIDLVKQSLVGNLPLSQNVAQAITLNRGIGGIGWQ